MALTVLQVTIPLLGFLTLDKIIKEEYNHKKIIRSVLWAAGITGGFCLLMALFPGIAGDFSAASDAGMQDVLVDALREDRRAMLRNDARGSFLIIAVAAAVLLWIYGKKEHFARAGRSYIAGGVIGLLVLFDLFSVGKRYLNNDHFISPKNWEAQFRERPVDKSILADKDLSYRVLDLSVNTFNDAHQSYRHKCIGGYSPVKLQRYQDLIERYISPEISKFYKTAGECSTVEELEDKLPYLRVTSMLNGKYIILGDDMAPVVNDFAYGNCWLVSDARIASSVNEEIDFLADTDLDNTVVLGPDFKDIASRIEDVPENSEDFIRMTSYEPNELHYECRLSSPRAVMFSEIYYPDGWKAWIGPVGEVGETIGNRFMATSSAKETDIFRGDWMLRGMIVPAGEHEIVMRFEPQSYAVGAHISTASSALLIFLVLLSAAGAVFYSGNAASCWRQEPSAHEKIA